MKTFAFYDAKPFDRTWFDKLKGGYDVEFKYIKNNLSAETAYIAQGCDGVVAFVNDTIDKNTITRLYEYGIKLIALRCAGYNNVDIKAAQGKIKVASVPAYSPYAVAEHALALLLTLNRKTHRAYLRTRDFDFSIDGLTGFDLHGKTMGVIGTGKIGQVFIDICRGAGMNIIAYDPYPNKDSGINYVELDDLYRKSDVISLHCPLTRESCHMINKDSIARMKDGVVIINTSRGSLIRSEDLLVAIKEHKIGAAGLDVYEEETELFFEDYSNEIIQDDVIARLLSMPNVIVTSHQAFLTNEALENIAKTTLDNIKSFYEDKELANEVIYKGQRSLQVECDK